MRILIIEDDSQLCQLLKDTLEQEGYTVDICNEGDDGLRWMQERSHDLVLLDRMLPRLDGVTLLRIAREQEIATPVLMLTALGSVEDRVAGLDVGADDYIVKPFSVKELLARIRAIGRRPRDWSAGEDIVWGDLSFQPVDRRLCCGEKSLVLSRREGDLLLFFLKSRGKLLPRHSIFSYVWGPDAAVEDGSLDNYIHFLRRHLRELGSRCTIVTARSSGYQMQFAERKHDV